VAIYLVNSHVKMDRKINSQVIPCCVHEFIMQHYRLHLNHNATTICLSLLVIKMRTRRNSSLNNVGLKVTQRVLLCSLQVKAF